MAIFGIRLVTAVPIFLRWIGTPVQIYIKRIAESNPTFRTFIIKNTRWYNKKCVEMRLRRNNIERTEEQIAKIARLEEDKAVMAGAELLSSTLGTILTFIIMGIGLFLHDEDQKAKEEMKRLEREKLRNQLTDLTEKVKNINGCLETMNANIKELESSSDEKDAKIQKLEKALAEKELVVVERSPRE